MFFVLAGQGEYRLGDERLTLRAGYLVAAPAGEDAHQIIHNSSEDLRFLASQPWVKST
jgi:uncharacterized cupin superfamily protein